MVPNGFGSYAWRYYVADAYDEVEDKFVEGWASDDTLLNTLEFDLGVGVWVRGKVGTDTTITFSGAISDNASEQVARAKPIEVELVANPYPTALVIFAEKRKDIEKKYLKLRKRYTTAKKGRFTLKNIDVNTFRFKSVKPEKPEETYTKKQLKEAIKKEKNELKQKQKEAKKLLKADQKAKKEATKKAMAEAKQRAKELKNKK